jgi:hypothetical protein
MITKQEEDIIRPFFEADFGAACDFSKDHAGRYTDIDVSEAFTAYCFGWKANTEYSRQIFAGLALTK